MHNDIQGDQYDASTSILWCKRGDCVVIRLELDSLAPKLWDSLIAFRELDTTKSEWKPDSPALQWILDALCSFASMPENEQKRAGLAARINALEDTLHLYEQAGPQTNPVLQLEIDELRRDVARLSRRLDELHPPNRQE